MANGRNDANGNEGSPAGNAQEDRLSGHESLLGIFRGRGPEKRGINPGPFRITKRPAPPKPLTTNKTTPSQRRED